MSVRGALLGAASLALLGLAGAVDGADDKRIKLYSPDPLVVRCSEGKGSIDAWFRVSGDSTKPDSIVVIDPSSPEREPRVVAAFKDVPPDAAHDMRLFAVSLTATVRQPLEPEVPQKGKLLFGWKTASEPWEIDFSLLEESGGAFEVEPSALRVRVRPGVTPLASFTVRNTGHRPLGAIQVSSTGLVNTASNESVSLTAQELKWGARGALLVGGSSVVEVSLPVPDRAGTYHGDLVLSVAGRRVKTVAIDLDTRGPRGGTALPNVLFVAAALLGLALAQLLDAWESGPTKVRTQAIVAAGQLLERATILAGQLVALPRHKDRPAALQQHCRNVILTAHARQAALLQPELDAIDLSVRKLELLAWHVAAAGADSGILARLDEVDDQVALDDYAKRLLAAIGRRDVGGGVAPTESKVEVFGRSALRLLRVHQALAWVVGATVYGASAYAFFFQARPVFGTFGDYVTVALFSLGLTKTGAEVVSKYKSR